MRTGEPSTLLGWWPRTLVTRASLRATSDGLQARCCWDSQHNPQVASNGAGTGSDATMHGSSAKVLKLSFCCPAVSKFSDITACRTSQSPPTLELTGPHKRWSACMPCVPFLEDVGVHLNQKSNLLIGQSSVDELLCNGLSCLDVYSKECDLLLKESNDLRNTMRQRAALLNCPTYTLRVQCLTSTAPPCVRHGCRGCQRRQTSARDMPPKLLCNPCTKGSAPVWRMCKPFPSAPALSTAVRPSSSLM